MSNTMSLFENGNSLVSSDLFESLLEINNNLSSGSSSGGGGMRRISIRGGRFRQLIGGEQVAVSSDNSMNVVIVNAAPLSRTYYAGSYDPAQVVPPTCWTSDTKTPSPDVPEANRQSARCLDCPQNVKGSGQGESRACRYAQRIAVCIEGDYENVYQLQLPATSVFGDAKGGHMPMGAYAKMLSSRRAPAAAIVTQIYFDENSDTPKLFFKPLRPLEEAEMEQVQGMIKHPDTLKAIELTVSQTDGVIASDAVEEPAPAPKAKAKAKPAPVPEPVEEEEEIEEPVKAKKKSQPAPVKEEDDLDDLLDNWDD
jgi:hypothetical protein